MKGTDQKAWLSAEVPKSLKDRVKQKADASHTTISTIVRQALEAFVNKHQD